MRAVIDERQLTEEQIEQLELEEMAPEKFDPEITFKVNKSVSNVPKETSYGTYTREQVAKLLAASKAPCEPTPPREITHYPTMTREQCEALMRDHFEYKENALKKQKEREAWDSAKTTVLDTKIDTKPKRSKSTKA